MSKQPQQRVRYQKVPTSGKTRFGPSRKLYGIVGAVVIAVLIGASFLIGGRGTNSGGSAAAVTVGSVAPAFSGRDVISGRVITAKSLARKNVLYFFNAGSSCQACMVQAQALQQDSAQFTKAHMTLVVVTNDEASALVAAASAYKLTLPMVADPASTLTARFGAIGGPGMNMGNAADHRFIVVDKTGRVRFDRDYPNMWITPSALLKQLPKLS